MRISILGPLEVEGDEGPIAVKGLRLRAALRPYDVVESRPGGYALSVRAEDVDALLFRRTAGTGEGLELWRGPALADLLAVPRLANAAARLEEERLAAVETRAVARLAAGLPVDLPVDPPLDLSVEVAAHPLRERLCALAMRALAASGRQAEALELFERARRRLADELGVDPGDELRAAHLAAVSGAVVGSFGVSGLRAVPARAGWARWRTSRWSRSRPRAATRCWRRSGRTPSNGWRSRTRRAPTGGGTPRTSVIWSSAPPLSCRHPRRSAGSSGWPPSATTSPRRCAGCSTSGTPSWRCGCARS
ncbi:AfsR/SARP family transcriptional regulator [Nonomuraea sp. NPDC048882]|uniref:AfsR/SARP family transcriptional regulator n=1 Tax=Nonomuraea sp. NPDC048882 TaxID=3154347 RepID=UPI0033D87CEE